MKIHQLETLGYEPTEWLPSQGVCNLVFQLQNKKLKTSDTWFNLKDWTLNQLKPMM